MKLGVNIDHIAVLREARLVNDPNPLDAISICKFAGADQITIHLREDRRHIKDFDAKNIIEFSQLPVNLECSINAEIIDIVCELKPHRATLVPENRAEVTTEGGLDLEKYFKQINTIITKLKQNDIEVSLFIDPTTHMVELAKKLNSDWIELHTGKYANIYAMLYQNLNRTIYKINELDLPKYKLKDLLSQELDIIQNSAIKAKQLGLKVAAGHGLNYQNVKNIVIIKEIEELNIGQSIIARSIFVGLQKAIEQMGKLL
jgi:pyridoxine 5-phosphate synthase